MKDIFIEIIESIKRNRLRTALTGFAVAWGIFILIVLLGSGNGLINSMTRSMGNINLNTMDVFGSYTSKPYDGLKSGREIVLEERDVDLLESELFSTVIDGVTPVITQSLNVSYGKKHSSVSLCGCYIDLKDMYKIKLCAGRFINETDLKESRKLIVIPSGLAERLFGIEDNFEKAIGLRVKSDIASFLVVGVYQSDGMSMACEAYAPYSTIRSLFNKGKFVEFISFSYHGLEEEESEEFENRVRSVLNVSHRADPTDKGAIYISNNLSQNGQMEKARRYIKLFLWVVGFFTLLSGIVGVSNIMLITVKERTREFGIRKAIGARPWDVIKLIISESVAITAFFGYVGMVLGMIACRILDWKMGNSETEVLGMKFSIFVDPTVGLDVALEATLLLIVAGTVAGLVPALKAAKVRPIEALRAE